MNDFDNNVLNDKLIRPMPKHNPMEAHDASAQLQPNSTVSPPEPLESSIATQWVDRIHCSSRENAKDDPNYYISNPKALLSESQVQDFIIGSGDDIFEHLSAAISNAKSEIIFITCFWAKSKSLQLLGQALRKLSASVLETGRPKVRVRIGFSSISLWQKLSQTSSLLGRSYGPEQWEKKLGLPPAVELTGLEMRVQCIFVRPFSVMHPKFIIIDRRQVWVPSCNVSWETWFEGCIVLNGPIVQQFVEFWQIFWARDEKRIDHNAPSSSLARSSMSTNLPTTLPPDIFSKVHTSFKRTDRSPYASSASIPTVFLPSPHHRDPHFRFLPWARPAPAPPTPLNLFTLTLLGNAKTSISIQTPNLTSQPVLAAVLAALERGVHVNILTSQKLQVAEQLLTAGTTTSRCVNWLIRQYKKMLRASRPRGPDEDIERGQIPALGLLEIRYYTPHPSGGPGEPVQSHIKLLVADGEWVILGSGNMERASWFTSQELGVAFHDTALALRVTEMVREKMVSRTSVVWDSGTP